MFLSSNCFIKNHQPYKISLVFKNTKFISSTSYLNKDQKGQFVMWLTVFYMVIKLLINNQLKTIMILPYS